MLRGLRALRVAPLLLVSFGFFDEFASGVPAVGGFALREGFGSDITSLALAVLVAPQVLSLGVEPALVLWAGRRHRPTALAVGLGGMALSLWLGALAPDLLTFGLAFAVYAPASGVTLGLAEASLMDQRSSERERALTQWMLAGTLGDLAAPLLLWGLAALELGWRAALGATGTVLLGVSLVVLRSRIEGPPADASAPPPAEEYGSDEGPRWRPLSVLRNALGASRRRLRAARAHPGLLVWLCDTALCTFMDEALAVLVGLRVYRVTSDEVLAAQSLLGFTLGGCCGVLLLERRLRRAPAGPLLALACVGSALCFGAWVWFDVTTTSAVLLAIAGAFTTAHYPLALARAYAALPEDSTLVAATAQTFGAIDLGAPLVLGLIADRFGIGAALGTLLLQPLGILVAVWWSARSRLPARSRKGTLAS